MSDRCKWCDSQFGMEIIKFCAQVLRASPDADVCELCDQAWQRFAAAATHGWYASFSVDDAGIYADAMMDERRQRIVKNGGAS